MTRILVLRGGTPLLLALGMLAATGCSSEGNVSGKISYQGKPLTGGIVVFMSPGGSRTAQIGEDGTYSISHMPIGLAKIAVDTRSAQAGVSTSGGVKGPFSGSKSGVGGKAPAAPPKKDMKATMSPGKGVELPDWAKDNPIYNTELAPKKDPAAKIPDRYADPETSGLTFSVGGGSQEYNIELN